MLAKFNSSMKVKGSNTNSSIVYDIALIGAGPSNLFACFLAAGIYDMKICLIESSNQVGGKYSSLYRDKKFYNMPTYTSISSTSLVSKLSDQYRKYLPTEYLGHRAEEINKLDNGNFEIKTNCSTGSIIAKKIILGIGAGYIVPKKLGIDGCEECEGKTLFYSVENVLNFERKKVLIAGGGNSAADWAIMLSEYADITMVNGSNELSCYADRCTMISDLSANNKIGFFAPYTISEINANKGRISSVILKNNISNATMALEVNYILAFFGLSSDLSCLKKWKLATSSDGLRIIVDSSNMMTNIDGIYAIGSIANNRKYKSITAGFAEAEIVCAHIRESLYPDAPINIGYSGMQHQCENV